MIDVTFRGTGGDFHYVDWEGPGALAHFSHATGFCARMYSPLAARLAPALRLVGLDDRGHGRTTVPADPGRLRSWDIFSKDLELFIEHLGSPVIALGHSRGAVASLMLAVRRPDLIRALILIDPTILPYSWMWWWYLAKKTGLAHLVPIAARAAKRRDYWPDLSSAESYFRSKDVFQGWTPGFLEGYLVDGLRDKPGGGLRLACSPAWESRCFAVCNHDVWRYVPQPTQPVLIIHGLESDTFLPAALKRYRRVASQTTFLGLEQTSHFVPMERPDETARAITDFLRENGLLT